jgi:hypothetical protein
VLKALSSNSVFHRRRTRHRHRGDGYGFSGDARITRLDANAALTLSHMSGMVGAILRSHGLFARFHRSMELMAQIVASMRYVADEICRCIA